MMLLDTESSFSGGKNCTQRRKAHLGGTRNEQPANKKAALTWVTRLFLATSSSSSYLVLPLGSASIWLFWSIASAPYCGSYPDTHLHQWLQHSCPLILWMFRYFLPWDVLWDLICNPLPFQKGLCPRTLIERLFTVVYMLCIPAINFPVASLFVK